MTNRFSKKEAIHFGWETAKSNLGFFISLLLVIITIFVIGEFVVKTNISLRIVFNIISVFLSVLIDIGLIKIAFKIM